MGWSTVAYHLRGFDLWSLRTGLRYCSNCEPEFGLNWQRSCGFHRTVHVHLRFMRWCRCVFSGQRVSKLTAPRVDCRKRQCSWILSCLAGRLLLTILHQSTGLELGKSFANVEMQSRSNSAIRDLSIRISGQHLTFSVSYSSTSASQRRRVVV